MKKTSRILSILFSEVIALTCLWPGSTVMAQGVAAPLDKNDPEIRAVLAEIESDIEKGRQEKKIAGRYVIIDTNAVRTLTFSEFDVSIVNQKLVVTVPELLPGSVVYMKETPLAPYRQNVFYVDGGSFYGNRMTFESNQDGSMILKCRNHVFKRQP